MDFVPFSLEMNPRAYPAASVQHGVSSALMIQRQLFKKWGPSWQTPHLASTSPSSHCHELTSGHSL